MKKIYLFILVLLLSIFITSSEIENSVQVVIMSSDEIPNESLVKINEIGKTRREVEIREYDENIIVRHKEKNLEREFKYLDKGSVLDFDETGNLLYARFIIGKDAEICNKNSCVPGIAKYKIGDYEYTIPKNSKVIYYKEDKDKQDSIKIVTPKDGEIYFPEKIKEIKNPKETKIDYNLPENAKKGDSLIVLNGEDKYRLIKRDEFDFGINYDGKLKSFFIKEAQQIDNLEIGYMESSGTYLFLGEEIPKDFSKTAIKLGKGNNPEIELFTPAGSRGTSVKILPSDIQNGNKKYGGLKIDTSQNLVLWAVGAGKDFGSDNKIDSDSKIKIENIAGRTLTTTTGAFRIFNGNQLIRYNEHTGGNVKVRFLDDVLSSTDSSGKEIKFDFSKSDAVPMEIDVKDKNGIDLKFKNSVTGKFEDENILVLTGKNKKGIITTGNSETALGKVVLESLPTSLRSVFKELDPSEQKKLLKNPGNIQEELNRIKTLKEAELKKIAEENNRIKSEKKNPGTTKNNVNSNVPSELRNVEIPADFVKNLNSYSKGWFSSKYVSKLSNKENSKGVVAIIFGSENCDACTTLEKNIRESNMKGLIYKIDHSNAQVRNKFSDLGINPDLIKLYPTTVYIDSINGKVIGWEEGNLKIDFNQHLK